MVFINPPGNILGFSYHASQTADINYEPVYYKKKEKASLSLLVNLCIIIEKGILPAIGGKHHDTCIYLPGVRQSTGSVQISESQLL
jgi:hypothetical protein